MPVFLGIPLIGWIQMVFGTAVVLFALIKYLRRPKMKKTDGFLIRDVHVIIGDGSELFHQNVLVREGIIKRISSDSTDRSFPHVRGIPAPPFPDMLSKNADSGPFPPDRTYRSRSPRQSRPDGTGPWPLR